MSNSIEVQTKEFFEELHALSDFQLKDGAPTQEVLDMLLGRAAMVATIGNVPESHAVTAFTRALEDAHTSNREIVVLYTQYAGDPPRVAVFKTLTEAEACLDGYEVSLFDPPISDGLDHRLLYARIFKCSDDGWGVEQDLNALRKRMYEAIDRGKRPSDFDANSL